ncbi:unnamed protein product, partial [Durusdinium trenchii]
MSGRRPLSPPPPRRRRKVGFVEADSDESGWQLPRPVVDRGLEGSWAEHWVETPIDAAPIEPSGDQVVDWWNSDGKANESLDVDSCPTGAWEHYRMNGN